MSLTWPAVKSNLGKTILGKETSKRMNGEAERDIDIFPALEWIYIGQRAIFIELQEGDMGSRRVVATTQIENANWYFKKVFGAAFCTEWR